MEFLDVSGPAGQLGHGPGRARQEMAVRLPRQWMALCWWCSGIPAGGRPGTCRPLRIGMKMRNGSTGPLCLMRSNDLMSVTGRHTIVGAGPLQQADPPADPVWILGLHGCGGPMTEGSEFSPARARAAGGQGRPSTAEDVQDIAAAWGVDPRFEEYICRPWAGSAAWAAGRSD